MDAKKNAESGRGPGEEGVWKSGHRRRMLDIQSRSWGALHRCDARTSKELRSAQANKVHKVQRSTVLCSTGKEGIRVRCLDSWV